MTEEVSIYFDNPATDPLGHEHVEGRLFFGEQGISLDFKVKDRAFRKGEAGSIAFGYEDIESIRFTRRFLGPRILTLGLRSAVILEPFPGAEVGKARLHVTSASGEEAKKVESLVEYRKSEAYLSASHHRLEESRRQLGDP